MPLTQVQAGMMDSTAQYYSFKNRLINGNMVIDQRNVGASVTPTATGQYTLDRWFGQVSQNSKLTVQQNAGSVTPPAGFTNYLGVTSSSAYSVLTGDYFSIRQGIEGYNTADLGFGTANAATVTLSFWVRSSLTGTFGATLQSFFNGASTRTYPFTYTISAANTWEYKTVTIAGDTTGTWVGATNGLGISVAFGLGCGSTFTSTAGSWQSGNFIQPTGTVSVVGTNGATFYVTGVQLEKGSTATSFDYRPYGTELVLCQRYFEKSFNQNSVPDHNVGGLPVIPTGGSLGCGGNAYWIVSLKVTKRISTYTIRWYDPLGAHPSTENWVRYITACNSGSAAGPNSNMTINSNTNEHFAGYSQLGTDVPPIFYWTVDAEL